MKMTGTNSNVSLNISSPHVASLSLSVLLLLQTSNGTWMLHIRHMMTANCKGHTGSLLTLAKALPPVLPTNIKYLPRALSKARLFDYNLAIFYGRGISLRLKDTQFHPTLFIGTT
jgi:hypothetical protein